MSGSDYSLYHGLAIYTEVTFVNVHHAHMSTFVIKVCLRYTGFVNSVHLIILLRRLIENTGCGIMSVSHTTNWAELRTLIYVE